MRLDGFCRTSHIACSHLLIISVIPKLFLHHLVNQYTSPITSTQNFYIHFLNTVDLANSPVHGSAELYSYVDWNLSVSRFLTSFKMVYGLCLAQTTYFTNYILNTTYIVHQVKKSRKKAHQQEIFLPNWMHIIVPLNIVWTFRNLKYRISLWT